MITQPDKAKSQDDEKPSTWLNKPIDRYLAFFEPRVSWVLNLLFLLGIWYFVYLFLSAELGLSSRYLADDFSSANATRQYGVIGALNWTYNHYSGRYAATLIVALASYLTRGVSWYFPALIIAIWFIGCWVLAGTLVRLELVSPKLRLFVATVPIFFTLTFFANLYEPLYWEDGNCNYALPVALLFVQIALLARVFVYPLTRRQLIAYGVATGLLALTIAGFNECMAPLQIAAYCFGAIGIFWIEKPRRKPILIVAGTTLLAAVIGLFIIVHAPGNAVRESQFASHPKGFRLLSLTYLYYSNIWYRYITLGQDRVVAALIVCALAAKQAAPPASWIQALRLFIAPLAAFAIGAVLIFVCYLVTTYATAATPFHRTMFVPVSLLATTVAALGLIFGRILKTLYAYAPTPVRRFATPWACGIAALYLALILNGVPEEALSKQGEVSGSRASAILWDRDNQFLLSQRGKKFVQVSGTDYTAFRMSVNRKFWINREVATYYGIGAIALYFPMNTESGDKPLGGKHNPVSAK